MIYCKNCLNVSTRPNIKFTEEGLCPPCAVYLNPVDINWDERIEELKEVIAFGKVNNHSGYDCIIGVSGGKDSTRQALFVKENLGMNPLLVSLNYPPDQMSQTGADNLSNLIQLGFDCVNVSCSPQIWKKLMREAFYEYGNWAKATEIALFSSVPRAAIAYQIPLIWWGENAAIVLGQLERATELVENRIEVAKIFDDVIDNQTLLIKQHNPSDCINSFWCYSVYLNTDNPKVDWYKFRDLFQKNGGDGYYAAWKLSYFEPLFLNEIQNYEGVWQKYSQGLCPVAEFLQPRMIQLKTNYWDLDEAKQQVEILRKTIAEYISL